MNEEAQEPQPIPSETPPQQPVPSAQPAAEDNFDEQERRELDALRAENGFGEAPPARNAGVSAPPEPAPERTPEPAAAQQAAANAPEPARKPSVLPKADPRREAEYLRRELRSRDGKHGREIESLTRENESLKQQIAEINRRLAGNEAARKEAESAPAAPAEMSDEELRKVFGDDVDINGADYYRTMLKVAQYAATRAAPKGNPTEEIGKLVKAEVAAIREENHIESVMDEVEREMPGYRQLNEQADVNGFASYLNELFPGTQFTRREVAENALARVAATARTDKAHAAAMQTLESVVRGFASPRSPKPETTSHAPQKNGRPRFEPSRYVTPRPVATTPPPKSPGAERRYTEAELDAMRMKALSEGPGAYDRFEAFEMDLRRTDRVTA